MSAWPPYCCAIFLYRTIRARISWTVIFPLLTPSGRLHMRYTHSTHYDNRWDGLLDVCVLRFTALRALTYVCTWVCVCVWNGKYTASKQQTQQNQSKTGERLNSFSDSYDDVRMNRGFASWILTYPILRATYVWIYVSDSNHIHPSWMNTSNPAFLISFVCKKIFRETKKNSASEISSNLWSTAIFLTRIIFDTKNIHFVV